MILNVSGLTLGAQTGTWFRALSPSFLATALAAAHSKTVPSRFNPGPLAVTPFELLYLAETHLVALFEVQALFGSPTRPGGVVPNPLGSWVLVNAQVSPSRIADLTDPNEQMLLQTNAQELTGDWRGYQQRSVTTSVTTPIGTAPTQSLGEAVWRDSRDIEGFRTSRPSFPIT